MSWPVFLQNDEEGVSVWGSPSRERVDIQSGGGRRNSVGWLLL